jgi:hypothetical protein
MTEEKPLFPKSRNPMGARLEILIEICTKQQSTERPRDRGETKDPDTEGNSALHEGARLSRFPYRRPFDMYLDVEIALYQPKSLSHDPGDGWRPICQLGVLNDREIG